MRSPRRRSRCHQRWSGRSRPARRGSGGDLEALASASTLDRRRWRARAGGDARRASTSSRRAWKLPALAIGPRRWRRPTGPRSALGPGRPMLARQRRQSPISTASAKAVSVRPRAGTTGARPPARARVGGELDDLLIEADRGAGRPQDRSVAVLEGGPGAGPGAGPSARRRAGPSGVVPRVDEAVARQSLERRWRRARSARSTSRRAPGRARPRRRIRHPHGRRAHPPAEIATSRSASAASRFRPARRRRWIGLDAAPGGR